MLCFWTQQNIKVSVILLKYGANSPSTCGIFSLFKDLSTSTSSFSPSSSWSSNFSSFSSNTTYSSFTFDLFSYSSTTSSGPFSRQVYHICQVHIYLNQVHQVY